MRIAYLECFSGISGDMFMGALVDAGVPQRLFEETVAALNVGARLEISRVVRSGISATKVDVYVDGEKDMPRDEFWGSQMAGSQPEAANHHHEHSPHDEDLAREQQAGHGPGHSHVTGTSPAGALAPHLHGHSHEHIHEHAHGHVRGLKDIREIIGKAAISENAKQTAGAIFEALGAAEAKIHNTSIDAVHFHEVGAVDAIVDIVCAAVGVEALTVEEIVSSPLNVGGGTVKCAHGTLQGQESGHQHRGTFHATRPPCGRSEPRGSLPLL